MRFTSSLKLKLIYVFRINDTVHRGCLKIGEATCEDENVFGLSPNSKALNEAARKRINQYTQTAGIAYDLLYTELTVYNRSGLRSFNDKEVHNVLERSGIKKKVFDTVNKANEWFITDLETVKRAITAVKEGRSSLSSAEVTREYSPIVFRPEQQEAINKTKKQFKKGNQMLWNAKMRFGKTLSALQVVKDMEFQRTLILTHRPVWMPDGLRISVRYFTTARILHTVPRITGKVLAVLNGGQKATDCIMSILHPCRICVALNLWVATSTKTTKCLLPIGT